MKIEARNRLLVVLLALFGVFLVWLPFYLKLTDFWGLNFSEGIQILWKNFDGPNYLVIAKSWYDKKQIAGNFSTPLPLEYYPAHWPLYPLLISIFDFFLPGPWAMMTASVLGLMAFYWVLPAFLKRFGVSEKNIWRLVIVSLVLPARWLALRAIGSPEAWFMTFVMLSLISYKNKEYLKAGVWGSLAQLTKSPAILLFLGFGVYELIRLVSKKTDFGKIWRRIVPMILMPLTILLVFGFYYLRTGNFWAYFNSGDNFHLFWPPFSIFGKGGVWVGDFWLEEIIWLWLIYGMALVNLWKKNQKLLASFAGTFFVSTLFVSHRDMSRYIIPLLPMVLIGWKEVLVKKELKWILGLLVLPALLFSWNFLLNNVAPVADWAPYL